MRNRIFVAAIALLLAACGEKPKQIESVESLMANLERLKELRAQCKADHDKVGDAQCNAVAVAEATRRRFMGSGTPNTPKASSAESTP